MHLPEIYNKFRKLGIQINDRNAPESKPHVDPTAINNALIRGGACASHDSPDVCSDLVEFDIVLSLYVLICPRLRSSK